jgi:hypothetical protein
VLAHLDFAEGQALDVLRAFMDLRPGDAVGRAQDAPFPIRAQERAVAEEARQRRIVIRHAVPLRAVGGKPRRAGPDRDEMIASPDDRVEMLPFESALRLGPLQTVAAVQSTSLGRHLHSVT